MSHIQDNFQLYQIISEGLVWRRKYCLLKFNLIPQLFWSFFVCPLIEWKRDRWLWKQSLFHLISQKSSVHRVTSGNMDVLHFIKQWSAMEHYCFPFYDVILCYSNYKVKNLCNNHGWNNWKTMKHMWHLFVCRLLLQDIWYKKAVASS